MNSGRFGKNMAAEVSAKKIAEMSRIFCRNVFAETSLPKRPAPIRCMHARPNRRKDQLPLRSVRHHRSRGWAEVGRRNGIENQS